MFLEKDQESVQKESQCYAYCLVEATKKIVDKEFGQATIYLENMIRSLNELERMKQNKRLHDETLSLIKRLNERGIRI